jgi:hypothetical protein
MTVIGINQINRQLWIRAMMQVSKERSDPFQRLLLS